MNIYRVDGGSPKWMITAYDYVRTDAFCFGQNIPIEREFESDDLNEPIRIVLIVDDHKPIAGLRITYPEDGVAKIGRVCVIREKQKSGVGRVMMSEAENWILSEGVCRIVITSQDRAVGFYTKLGYRQTGEIDTRPANFGFSCVTVEKNLTPEKDE